MLKKQINTLNRILNWERLYREGKPCGIHPARDGYIVTEGHVAVLLWEKPDGFSETDRQDDMFKQIQNDCNHGDHVLALTVTTNIIKEWKRLRAGKTHKTGAVPVEITAKYEGGSKVSGFFNPISWWMPWKQ